jgi:ubiquinone/menaquinone biosynthesis C-methylase UbiE
MKKFKQKKVCVCCGSKRLGKLVDLGEQPLANSFKKTKNEKQPEYPLAVNFCKDCTHLQLTHIVNPDELFKNYLYVSGTTETLKNYFKNFSYWAHQYLNEYRRDEFNTIVQYYKQSEIELDNSEEIIPNLSVLDIACNDGSQLDAFKEIGFKTYGIDPAKNLAELSRKNHSVVCDYFNGNSLKGKKFDIITAQNVFAHVENPLKFLKDCKRLIKDNGLIFIQVSQSDMLHNIEFDTIYHEHISYFSDTSMSALLKRAELNLVGISKADIHGGSKIYVLGQKGVRRILDAKSIVKTNHYTLKEFNSRNNFEISTTCYQNSANEIRTRFFSAIMYYKTKGYTIYCYGAAAKGMTFLNYANPGYIKAIIDDNRLKIGLFTPGTNIQVKGINTIKRSKAKKILFVCLAWNFYDEIKKRIKNVRDVKDDRFLVCFPEWQDKK